MKRGAVANILGQIVERGLCVRGEVVGSTPAESFKGLGIVLTASLFRIQHIKRVGFNHIEKELGYPPATDISLPEEQHVLH